MVVKLGLGITNIMHHYNETLEIESMHPCMVEHNQFWQNEFMSVDTEKLQLMYKIHCA